MGAMAQQLHPAFERGTSGLTRWELPSSIVSEQNCPIFAIGNSTLAAPRNTLQFLLFSNDAVFFPYRFAHATAVCQ